MDQPAITLQDAIDDLDFRNLLRLLHRDAMTWDTFLENPLPSGMSPVTAWTIMNKIGQCAGIELIPNIDGAIIWYRPIHALSEGVNDICLRSTKGSTVYQSLLSGIDQNYLNNMRIEEACSAASIAGFMFDREQVELLYATGVVPKEGIARVIHNMIELDSELERYQSKAFSNSLFNEFRDRLLEGIHEEDLDDMPRVAKDEPIDEEAWNALQVHLDYVIDYANHKRGEKEDPPILRGCFIGDHIVFHQSFGPLSALMASLIARLYFLKNDFAVLRLIPLSAMKLCWINDELSVPQVFCRKHEYDNTMQRCLGDITFHQIVSVQLVSLALEEIEKSTKAAAEQDILIRDLLNYEPEFNHRQRSIIARALRTPNAEFRIGYHQRKHNIAYATARRDLIELKDKGYLRIDQNGKEFVFLPDTRIKEFSIDM